MSDVLGYALGIPMLVSPAPAAAGDTTPGGENHVLLLETDDGLLLESGNFLILE